MRFYVQAAALIAGLTVTAPAFAQWHDRASTTRIETRPYYGATVTVEHGVRVYRGLPPTRHMIINPHGQTPLELGIHDTRVYEKSENHYYDHSSNGVPSDNGVFGGAVFDGGDFVRRGKPRRKRSGELLGGPRKTGGRLGGFRPRKKHHR